jgi:hypothetical protein
MNERISDQVICSEDDVSYSAYDFWYERLSKLGKEEEIEFGVMRLYFGVDILHFLMYSKLRVRRTLTS